MILSISTTATILLAMMTSSAASSTADHHIETLVSGLTNPCGIAVQPETGMLYISDSGNSQVLRFSGEAGSPATPVITGFGKDVYGKGPMYDIGPLGLLFLDSKTLVIGGGGRKDGDERVWIFDNIGDDQLTVDDATTVLGPVGPGSASAKGEGNFYDLAADDQGIYITANGDDTKGWVLRVPLVDREPSSLEPFIATKLDVDVDAPVGIEVGPSGNLWIGQMGEITVPLDSLVLVYNPTTGELLHSAEAELFDIAGLAVSPTTGELYAIDYAWMDTTKGGLFRLDVEIIDEEMTVTPEMIATLDKPTAMAFDSEGTLYVTVIGTAEDGSSAGSGKLLKINLPE